MVRSDRRWAARGLFIRGRANAASFRRNCRPAFKTKKAKVGDPVKARTTAEVKLTNGVTVPAGLHSIGRTSFRGARCSFHIVRRMPEWRQDHASETLHPCRDDAGSWRPWRTREPNAPQAQTGAVHRIGWCDPESG